MNRTPVSLHSPREEARLQATLRQARNEGGRTQHNPDFVAFAPGCAVADARCTCGAYLYRAEIPHPDRDVHVYPRACEKCRKAAFLRDLGAELDQALWDVWASDPLAMMAEA